MRLKELRQERGLTQAQVAQAIDKVKEILVDGRMKKTNQLAVLLLLLLNFLIFQLIICWGWKMISE